MKKIVFLILLFCSFMPVFAVCSITGGACFIGSSYEQNNTEQNLADTIQKDRAQSYSNQYIQNIYSPDWNYISEPQNDTNCQFGICLNKPVNKKR